MLESLKAEGFVDAGFEPVRDAFEKNFADGFEVGASFAVAIDGKPVVDLWGGFKDQAKTQPWEKDTTVNVWSTTKGPTALAIAMLVDRGQLDYDATVATYWPEFAAGGKESVTVGQLMSHQAGVCGLREPIETEAYYDQTFMAEHLAAMEPFWTPGDGSGYHAITYGHLTNELMRRIDGRTMGTFIAEEIAGPLGVDFYVGLPAEREKYIAEMVPPAISTPLSNEDSPDYTIAAMGNPALDAEAPNTRAWRAAEIPSAGGQSNARSLARLYAAMAMDGELDGIRLISPEALDKATAEQCQGQDRNIPLEVSWGAGFMRYREMATGERPPFGHAGWGGSMATADRDNKMSFAYAMNQMNADLNGDPRTLPLIAAVYQCLG